MRIEEVDKTKLSKASDKELLILKLRFTQAWDRNLKNQSPVVVSDLTKGKFLQKYKLLLDTMNNRKVEHSTSAIDKAAFKKAMIIKKYGIDVSEFEDITVFPCCVKVEKELLADTEKIASVVKSRQLELCEAIGLEPGVDAAYVPVYDLVLKARQDTVLVEVSKPYPNEHSARLQEPSKFDSTSFRRTSGGTLFGSKKVPSTISIIWGKLKGKAKPSDPPIAQALRFPTKDWTAVKAKKWLKDNKITFISWEAATKTSKKIWSAKYIKDLPDDAFLHVDVEKGSRYFPYKDNTGKVDLPHLEEALVKVSQSDLPKTEQDKVSAIAKKILDDIKEGKKFEKEISVYAFEKANEDEHVVCGIVYEPDVVDAQGDKANEVEIRKAAYQFMEEVQTFRVMHKGKKVKVKVLESYLAPSDFTVVNKTVKKGTWVITVRVLDKKIWKAVKDGSLTGFSMAGYASTTT